MLDDIDLKLLNLLQEDCRATNAQLASNLSISPSSCWRRVKSLEEIGLIEGYRAQLDRSAAGFEFSAILHVSLSRQKEENVQAFIDAINERPEILDCYATTGDADYHLRVVVRNIAEFNKFLDEFIFRLPGIAHVKSNIVLKDIKSSGSLPLLAN
ncbi:winged helix-turn-helix transcriptional regulator [Sneathiella sp. P13V-1]|uniref:Lrp/AsnC family transcriptional regulator n=1 Tax=Sneathiella sp. P13V-1 TaxID=2697366 RepID=UPI00187B1D8A|nr:Lrp/AsnC family transcriptional regulator [Sneathiella sp. P13V-1]MBE7636654.1 winged helix-turn-helix transcriptional regulator [Sneathiella sp. P13V-1]